MSWMLVTYDIEVSSEGGAARLRRVAKACERYGERVQKSVFELDLTAPEAAELLHELEEIIDVHADSVRVYQILQAATKDLGVKRTGISPDEAIII